MQRKMFKCPECHKEKFSTKTNLNRHMRTKHKDLKLTCDQCGKTDTRTDNMARHVKTHAEDVCCLICRETLKHSKLEVHVQRYHSTSISKTPATPIFISGTTTSPGPGPAVESDSDKDSDSDSDSDSDTTASDADNEYGANGWNPTKGYTIQRLNNIKSRKWKAKQANYQVIFKPLPLKNWEPKLYQQIESVLEKITAKAPENNYGRIAIQIPDLNPINIGYGDIQAITANDVFNKMMAVLNSNQEVDLGFGFQMDVIFAELPTGGARAKSLGERTMLNKKKWVKRKGSVIDPAKDADDDLCLSRCLVVAKYMADTVNFRDSSIGDFKTLVNSRLDAQRSLARQLHIDANVPLPKDGMCGLTALDQFQQYLKDYQLVVYNDEADIIYKGDFYKTKKIFLYLEENHFQLINPYKIKGFLGGDNFCGRCLKSWKGRNKMPHRCSEATCGFCKHADCPNVTKQAQPKTCKACNLTFQTKDCFHTHKKNGQCDKTALCLICWEVVFRKTLQPPMLHNCMQNYCSNCKAYREIGHTQCYVEAPENFKAKRKMKSSEDSVYDLSGERDEDEGHSDDETLKLAKKGGKSEYIFADFEADLFEGKRHVPNLLVLNKEDGTKYIYEGNDATLQFVEDLLAKKELQNKTYVFHNFSGYDSYHLLPEIYRRSIDAKPIFRGSRILSMDLKPVKARFIDSFLHMPMALSKMPKAYGFEDHSKGFFPYRMATKENRHYKGPFPPLSMFDDQNLASKQRDVLVGWHTTEQKRYDESPTLIYDLNKANKEYCINDTEIHKLGVGAYRKQMMEMFDGLDPMERITLPSYCNLAFRTLMMEPKTIAILPENGYGRRTHSADSIVWLESIALELGLDIKHARNANECKIGPFFVDGFATTEAQAQFTFEYQGCYFHAHEACRSGSRWLPEQHDEMMRRREQTERKLKFLRDRGFQVVTIYECEFKRKILEGCWGPEAVRLMTRLGKGGGANEPLKPRDSLSGGRTDCIYKLYTPKVGETIYYYDINSLYPSVNFSSQHELWPIGHPKIYFNSFPPIMETFGLVKGVFEPPTNLFHPVLGIKANNKLIYGLCQTCVLEEAKTYCTHKREERFITGTFVSEEIKLVLRMGYKLVELHEVWHWDASKRSETLFRPYIQRAYREKIEASGWPSHIVQLINAHGDAHYEVAKEKTIYSEKIRNELGIEIRPEHIENNPARRAFAKLVLNNFWGFWAKKSNPSVTKFVKKLEDFYTLIKDKEVTDFFIINENMMCVQYNEKLENEKQDRNTNVVLGSFTTCYARKRLYNYLQTVGDRALYMDTDSVIWIDRPNEPKIQTGDLLGEMKDEILDEYGPDATISAYAGAGAKSYTIIVTNKNTNEIIDKKMRMKGVKPTFKTERVLNPDKMIEIVKENLQIEVEQRVLHRDKKKATMEWREMTKIVRPTFSKRLPPDTLTTPSYPIGTVNPYT